MGTSLIPLPPQITLYGLLDGPLEPLFPGTASVAREVQRHQREAHGLPHASEVLVVAEGGVEEGGGAGSEAGV